MNSLSRLPPLKPGHIWQNVAPVGEAPDWREVPAPADWHRSAADIVADGERLFGYDRAAFMAKQYRSKA